MTTEFDRIALVGKVQRARHLAETARWHMLDVVIFLNRVEEDLTAKQINGAPRSGLLGEDENHEDYQPGDDGSGESRL